MMATGSTASSIAVPGGGHEWGFIKSFSSRKVAERKDARGKAPAVYSEALGEQSFFPSRFHADTVSLAPDLCMWYECLVV